MQGQVPLNVDFSAAQRIYGQIRDHLSTYAPGTVLTASKCQQTVHEQLAWVRTALLRFHFGLPGKPDTLLR